MKNKLSDKDRYELESLVEQSRNLYDLGMGPLGDGILQFVTKLHISILYLPIDEVTNEYSLSGVYLSSQEKRGDNLSFIGVNTSEYYDTQLFIIAHELYHHLEKECDIHLCRDVEGIDSLREQKANQFAASFLLPVKALKKEIYEKNNYALNMNQWALPALLRFIARIHLGYKLPYKAIIQQLEEVKAITDPVLLQILKLQNTRESSSLYYKLGISFDKDLFVLLNTRTYKQGASALLLEAMLQNMEGAIVSIDELANDLSLFGKKVEDFGLVNDDENVFEELIKELEKDNES